MCGNQVATCIEEANSNHHGIDYSKKFELCSSISNPGLAWENLRTTTNKKINKIFAPVFTGKFLWVISKYKYKT